MIPRDGAAISLWQQTADPYIQNNIATNTNYDVIIVGGGITGISLALQLQKSGKKCIVLEANSICFGTSGGTTAHLNTMLDTPYTTIIKNFGEENAKLVARAVKEAISLIKSNIEDYKINCGFKEVPGYLFAQDEKQERLLEDIFEACGKVDVTASFTDTIPVPIPFTKAIEIPAQGKLSPVEYIYVLANAFETAGGVIVQDKRVTGYTQRKDEVANREIIEAETQSGNYTGHALVYATHIPPGVNIMHFRCAPYRTYVMAVKLADENYPDDLIYDMYDPYHYYRTQEINGENILLLGVKIIRPHMKKIQKDAFINSKPTQGNILMLKKLHINGHHNIMNQQMAFLILVICLVLQEIFLLQPVMGETALLIATWQQYF
jgi:glycine/D-amino acid oxidase-like deaminating enzyme